MVCDAGSIDQGQVCYAVEGTHAEGPVGNSEDIQIVRFTAPDGRKLRLATERALLDSVGGMEDGEDSYTVDMKGCYERALSYGYGIVRGQLRFVDNAAQLAGFCGVQESGSAREIGVLQRAGFRYESAFRDAIRQAIRQMPIDENEGEEIVAGDVEIPGDLERAYKGSLVGALMQQAGLAVDSGDSLTGWLLLTSAFMTSRENDFLNERKEELKERFGEVLPVVLAKVVDLSEKGTPHSANEILSYIDSWVGLMVFEEVLSGDVMALIGKAKDDVSLEEFVGLVDGESHPAFATSGIDGQHSSEKRSGYGFTAGLIFAAAEAAVRTFTQETRPARIGMIEETLKISIRTAERVCTETTKSSLDWEVNACFQNVVLQLNSLHEALVGHDHNRARDILSQLRSTLSVILSMRHKDMAQKPSI